MFVETLHKVVLSKSLASFLFLAIGSFIKQHNREEEQDDVPGDNFPHAVMSQ